VPGLERKLKFKKKRCSDSSREPSPAARWFHGLARVQEETLWQGPPRGNSSGNTTNTSALLQWIIISFGLTGEWNRASCYKAARIFMRYERSFPTNNPKYGFWRPALGNEAMPNAGWDKIGPALPLIETLRIRNVLPPSSPFPWLRKLNQCAWAHPPKWFHIPSAGCEARGSFTFSSLFAARPRSVRRCREGNPGSTWSNGDFKSHWAMKLRGKRVRLAPARRCRFLKCWRTFLGTEIKTRNTRQRSFNHQQNLQGALERKY